ncbi:excinuclease ABC subunit UvrC [Fervidobacterium thailandense]|uniref:UvrABC system protein C n=1 Tax=Fervidobacterium thailandense TaxID=1008305 RepID=A0A1E3G3U3_9BACT|nr:excinuclease ABC subunit UvrC [Fervidobacterium thailandense]ODN30879.1 excinuclease ABC subunit C [Fervidobacterium thailandense]
MLEPRVLESVPNKPGVYIFKHAGVPIYIGKAKSLKKRLTSHFKAVDGKSKLIVSEADDLEIIILANEKEALILEAQLIFEHKPKYNALLKDTQVYPYIKVSDEPVPRVEIVRSRKGTGEFYGPFTNVQFTRRLFEVLRKIFKFRTCKKDLSIPRNRLKPCMDFHLGLCGGICVGEETEDEYFSRLEKMREVLKGNFHFVVDYVKGKMEQHAKLLDFENAAKYRDLLLNFNKLMESQGVVLPHNYNLDVIVGKLDVFLVFRIRSGFLVSKLVYEFDGELEEFIERYYAEYRSDIPERIIVEKKRGLGTVARVLGLKIEEPSDEWERQLLDKAIDNLNYETGLILSNKNVLRQMKELLGLKRVPNRIEGIDISHLAGKFTTASLVVFENGEVKKDEYRRYKLGNILNDYESIRTVVKRRYAKHDVPDLLFVDGGVGQVKAALQGLREIGKETDVVGIAKEEETIVTPSGSLKLPLDHPVLRLLVKLRDETHRVANTFTGKLSITDKLKSFLDEVEGIGPKRKRLILENFPSLEALKRAPKEDLERLLGKRTAQRLLEKLNESFHSQAKDNELDN